MKKHILLLLFISINISSFSQSLNNDLIEACYNNKEKAVFDLLRKGANPNAETKAGITALMYSVQNGNLFIVKELLQKGANPNIYSHNVPPVLINAVINNDTAMTYTLLVNGANPNLIDSSSLKSPLMLALENKNLEISELLLYFGADPNLSIADVSPLLHSIANNADSSLIKLLLKYNADPNKENSLGYSPLLLSILYDNLSLGKLLIENGASPTKKSKVMQLTPLEFAIKINSRKFIDLLLPFYSGNIDNDYYFALSQQNYYAAKKIKKLSNKKFLKPVFGQLIFSASSIFTYNDFFGGLKIGINEDRYKFDIKLGILSRPFPKAIIIQQSANNFLQFREYRTMLVSQIDKNFFLKQNYHYSLGLSIGYCAFFSYGKYRGSNTEIKHKFSQAPSLDLWYKKKNIKYQFSLSYLNIGTKPSLYAGFDIDIIIPTKN